MTRLFCVFNSGPKANAGWAHPSNNVETKKMKAVRIISIIAVCSLIGSAFAQEEPEAPGDPNPDFGNATFDPKPEVAQTKMIEQETVLRTVVCREHKVKRGTKSAPNEIFVRCSVPTGARVILVEGYARDSHTNRRGFCKSSTNTRYRECAIGWSAYRGQFEYHSDGRIAWRFANWLDRKEPRYAWLEVTYRY